MSPFRTCYFRTFEKFFRTSDLSISFGGPQVRRCGSSAPQSQLKENLAGTSSELTDDACVVAVVLDMNSAH
ncbi:hypothetical protein E2C01_052053 [Portunus trituberculatus]|uniref:Uncharacterized protein n=1 Tax=Portunus trituberculatus TaxID=210409 RepID=A0A5B7GKF0_PORTR|nr:hypothetical protein [Portunus trituberculatus]